MTSHKFSQSVVAGSCRCRCRPPIARARDRDSPPSPRATCFDQCGAWGRSAGGGMVGQARGGVRPCQGGGTKKELHMGCKLVFFALVMSKNRKIQPLRGQGGVVGVTPAAFGRRGGVIFRRPGWVGSRRYPPSATLTITSCIARAIVEDSRLRRVRPSAAPVRSLCRLRTCVIINTASFLPALLSLSLSLSLSPQRARAHVAGQ